MEYPKIQTLFLRDINNIIIPDKFTCPEFEYLKDCKWECTEKIDGTNIRIYINLILKDEEYIPNITIKGRTSKSNIPKDLYTHLEITFSNQDYKSIFPNLTPEDTICLYGEGYGNKIQKYGNRYLNDRVDFILFDVKFNDWWLSRKDIENIANKFNIMSVPLIGYMTIPEAIEFTKRGFKSTISEDKELDAEGLVLKTPYGLKFRNNNRIITKIKHIDFVKWNNKYGNNPNIVQEINPNYV